MSLNIWELIFVSAVTVALLAFGKATKLDRIVIEDRHAMLLIGAAVGLVFVVRAALW